MDERRVGYEGWRVTAAAGVGVYFASVIIVTFPILLKPLSEEFSWSRGAVSTAFGIAVTVAAICAAPTGYLLDRVGPRTIPVACLIVLGCAFASLSALTPRLWHLYAVYFVLGASGIGTSPVAYARAVSTWFRARRGMALALVITGGSLGGLLHPPVTAALSRAFGWRGACLGLGVMILLLGAPTVRTFVRERPAPLQDAGPLSGSSLREGLRSRAFWIIVAGIFCGTLLQNSVIVHLAALLTDRGFSTGHGAAALSAMAGSSIVGRLATGWLIDRMFAARVSMALMALAAIGAFLLSDTRSYGIAVIAAMLVGFGTGGEADIVPYLLSRYFGLRSFSVLYGLAWMPSAMGGALGPILMGRAFDTAGSYAGILAGLALTGVVATLLMAVLPRYDRVPA